MLKGNDLILSLVGTRLAAAKGCSVDRNVDTIEVCSPTDGAARNFVPTTTSWSISANGLYANASGAERLRQIWRAYQAGVHTPMRVQYRTSEGIVEQGLAIMTSLQEQGNVNELVKFSIQLQGTGKLENVSIPLNSFAGGEDTYMEYNGQLVIENESQGYEVLTTHIEGDDIHVRIDCHCSWFVFDGVNEQFVQTYINDGDPAIEQSLIKSGVGDAYVDELIEHQCVIAVCRRVGSPVSIIRQ